MNGPRDGGYDDAVSALRSHASQLGELLGAWQARDDSKPDAHARRTASGAVDAIDAAIRELHKIRQRLVSELRASDDATAARVDALLAERPEMTSRGQSVIPKTSHGPARPTGPCGGRTRAALC